MELAHEPWCAMSVWETRDLGVVRETPGSQPWPAITSTQHPRGPAPQCRPAPLLLYLSYQPCPRQLCQAGQGGGVSAGHTPTCLMHCSRSLVCWMCLSIEFILAVSLGSTREP